MQTDLTHAVTFVQAAVTIIFGLALGEALKQLVPDGDMGIRKDRVPLLLAFFFMVFPFFHGMSRYFYIAYFVHPGRPDLKLGTVSGHVMFDALMLMTEGGLFFVLCRSLSPTHWPRFYGFLLILLLVDTIWVLTSFLGEAPLIPWIVLNVVLAVILLVVYGSYSPPRAYADLDSAPRLPGWICAIATFATTVTSYVWMRDFYFPS
jgi:hypothetical protein